MEVTWIDQRNGSDCAICCIAMALDVSYERVMEVAVAAKAYDVEIGTTNMRAILTGLGLGLTFNNGRPTGDFVQRDRPYALSSEYFRDGLWGRPAIITLRSLNMDGYHAVFYDGEMVYDPSPHNRYTDFWAMEGLTDSVIFAPNFRDKVKR